MSQTENQTLFLSKLIKRAAHCRLCVCTFFTQMALWCEVTVTISQLDDVRHWSSCARLIRIRVCFSLLITSIKFSKFMNRSNLSDWFDVMGIVLYSDGVISREEMKNYFIKAHCLELSKGFSHTFQETTYFTPTFCDHCAGMVRNIFIIKLHSQKLHFAF